MVLESFWWKPQRSFIVVWFNQLRLTGEEWKFWNMESCWRKPPMVEQGVTKLMTGECLELWRFVTTHVKQKTLITEPETDANGSDIWIIGGLKVRIVQFQVDATISSKNSSFVRRSLIISSSQTVERHTIKLGYAQKTRILKKTLYISIPSYT